MDNKRSDENKWLDNLRSCFTHNKGSSFRNDVILYVNWPRLLWYGWHMFNAPIDNTPPKSTGIPQAQGCSCELHIPTIKGTILTIDGKTGKDHGHAEMDALSEAKEDLKIDPNKPSLFQTNITISVSDKSCCANCSAVLGLLGISAAHGTQKSPYKMGLSAGDNPLCSDVETLLLNCLKISTAHAGIGSPHRVAIQETLARLETTLLFKKDSDNVLLKTDPPEIYKPIAWIKEGPLVGVSRSYVPNLPTWLTQSLGKTEDLKSTENREPITVIAQNNKQQKY